MRKVQLNTACEGPLALNDNAFELCRDFIKPQGDRFFQQVSRYDNYLAEVAKKPGYQSGNTLKLILPFLKAHGLTNAQIEAYPRKTVALMPGAEDAFRFLRGRKLPIFEISTSYRQFAEAVGLKLGLDREHIFCTELDLDRYKLSESEAEELQRLVGEIAEAPAIELPAEATSLADLPGPAQEAVTTLDRIFGERLPAMEIGAILKEVNPFGGPEKAKAVADSLAKTGLTMADTIYVGDSITDVQAFEAVRAGNGLTISFNGNRLCGGHRRSGAGVGQRLVFGAFDLHFSVVGERRSAGNGGPGDPEQVPESGAPGGSDRSHFHRSRWPHAEHLSVQVTPSGIKLPRRAWRCGPNSGARPWPLWDKRKKKQRALFNRPLK